MASIKLTIKLDEFENETLALALAVARGHLQACMALALKQDDEAGLKGFKARAQAMDRIVEKLIAAAVSGMVSQDTDPDFDAILRNAPPGSMLN